jgi:hypothetical protein
VLLKLERRLPEGAARIERLRRAWIYDFVSWTNGQKLKLMQTGNAHEGLAIDAPFGNITGR